MKTHSLLIGARHIFIFWQKGEPSLLAPVTITPPKNDSLRADVPFSFGAGPSLPRGPVPGAPRMPLPLLHTAGSQDAQQMDDLFLARKASSPGTSTVELTHEP